MTISHIPPKAIKFTHHKFHVTVRFDPETKTWEWEATRVPKPTPIHITGMGMKSSEQARKDAIREIDKLYGED
jgi:hypothetical protein